MGSQRERRERLIILAELKKVNVEEGMSEILNRKLLEDYMIQMWYLGHQTRMDYLEVLFRSQTRWKTSIQYGYAVNVKNQ